MSRSNVITLTIYQGSTFTRRIEYRDSNGLPVDLTAYSARMQVRPSIGSTTKYFSLTTTPTSDGTGITMTPTSASVVLPATSGSFGITISAYSSSLVDFESGFFDLEIYSGSGQTEYVKRLLSGKVKMYKQVTI